MLGTRASHCACVTANCSIFTQLHDCKVIVASHLIGVYEIHDRIHPIQNLQSSILLVVAGLPTLGTS